MERKLYSVSLGPVVEGRPSEVEIVVARSFVQVAAFYEDNDRCTDVLSIQLLQDNPVIL